MLKNSETIALRCRMLLRECHFRRFLRGSRFWLSMCVEKIFCYLDIDRFEMCNIKCDPLIIDDLKERYEAVSKPFNMNPKYWIGIRFNSDMPDTMVKEMVKKSYLIVKGKKRG
jgi:predicted DNA-binding protein (MmcQ/YjbR family)